MSKKYIDIDKLREMYITQNMSLEEVSKKLNIGKSTLQRKLTENGIKKGKKLWLEKVKENNLKKYGVENISQLKDVKEKKKKKSLERYGVENISQSDEIKNKKKEKALKKYGVENVLQADVVRKKIKQTNITKYGTENPKQNEKVKEKGKITSLKKYGVDYPSKLPEIQEKIRKTNIKRYGVPVVLQSPEIKEKIKATNFKKYGKEYSSQVNSTKERARETCMKKYGVPYACMRDECRKANQHGISKINRNFSERLKENAIENKLEFALENFSYDIKLENSNVLIEIDPTYTHNSTNSTWFGKFEKPPISRNYHYNKTIAAKQNGYRCIHIFDWDNEEKIINLLKFKETLEARKCEIKKVSIEDAALFLNKNHLQGNCRGQDVRLGLYYNDELIEIMTFGKPRYNKKYDYELIRLCSHNKYRIIGGTERLFKFFLKEYKPKSIISYCDNSKFNGEVYERLKFKLKDYGKPSKHWYNAKTKKHVTDNLLRQRGYDQLFNANYGKGTSNEQLMIQNGFVEIYDCGQSTYIWVEQE